MSDNARTSLSSAVRNTSTDTDKLIGSLCRRIEEQNGLERQTRVSFYIIITDLLVLANLALSSEVLRKDIDTRFKVLAPKTSEEQTLDYKLSVVVFRAENREEKKKAGKIGRLLNILRKETDGESSTVIDYLLNNSGIEGVLRLHSPANRAKAAEKKGDAPAASFDDEEVAEGDKFDQDEEESYGKDDEDELTSPRHEMAVRAEITSDPCVQDRAWLLAQLCKLFHPRKILIVDLHEQELSHVLELSFDTCRVELEAGVSENDGFVPIKVARFL